MEDGSYTEFSTDWSRQVLYHFGNLVWKMTSRMATTAEIPIAPARFLTWNQEIASLQWNRRTSHNKFRSNTFTVYFHRETYISYTRPTNVLLVGKGAKKVNYGYLHNNYVWAVSTNAARLSRDHRSLSAKRCRVLKWLKYHVYRKPLELTSQKQYNICRWYFFPYVEKKEVELKLPEDQKVMLILDVFKGQITDKVTKLIE